MREYRDVGFVKTLALCKFYLLTYFAAVAADGDRSGHLVNSFIRPRAQQISLARRSHFITDDVFTVSLPTRGAADPALCLPNPWSQVQYTRLLWIRFANRKLER